MRLIQLIELDSHKVLLKRFHSLFWGRMQAGARRLQSFWMTSPVLRIRFSSVQSCKLFSSHHDVLYRLVETTMHGRLPILIIQPWHINACTVFEVMISGTSILSPIGKAETEARITLTDHFISICTRLGLEFKLTCQVEISVQRL